MWVVNVVVDVILIPRIESSLVAADAVSPPIRLFETLLGLVLPPPEIRIPLSKVVEPDALVVIP